ncbi:MAG: IS1634 family transposase [Kamptonema sp. SIO1D9]|nr:IS1634 family transposase [Kamptonema sp. SIO1D9]
MSIEVSNIDHLGLVAGIIDEVGIVEKINELIPTHKTEKINTGQAVKGMILNGLGLVSSPLYLFSRFFQGKATEHLLGKGIKPEYLNDDRLGRVLDELYQTGLNQVFISIVLSAVKKYLIEVGTVHLDSSSFQVTGQDQTESSQFQEEEPQVVKITYGYSKDNRPDLKQFMMNLICSHDGDVPLWVEIGNGNDSDTKEFSRLMREYKSQLKWDSLIVVDSAFYSQENLQLSQSISWLSRVPVTIKLAKKLIEEITAEELQPSHFKGYRYKELEKTYGGIPQRWLVVESEKRRESDFKKIAKNLVKEAQEAEQKVRQLSRQTFACIPDAKKASQKLLKKSKYHQLTNIEVEVIPSKKTSDLTQKTEYQVRGTVSLCEEKLKPIRSAAGRFIIATNLLDEEVLSAEEMLSKYKGQQGVERGFRFLKDPMFLTDSVFLKSPQRIESLGLIMGLCLLVYTLGQRQLRQCLQRRQATVSNQLGRPTNRPTLRWIFQCFQSIHLLVVSPTVEVSNLTEERLFLLKFFPPACQRYYLLS